MNDPRKELRKAKVIHKLIWKTNDIKAMALDCIESLCIAVEDGMKPKNALDLIYRFAHCACPCICYDSHDDWRRELKAYYKREFLTTQK